MSDYIKREDATAVIRKTLGSLGNSVITEINSLPGYVTQDYARFTQESTQDLISREAAREAIEDLMEIHFDRQVVLAKARDAIVSLPSADRPTGRWKEVYSETDYRNGWIEFSCECCEHQHGLESGEYGWSYGEPIPWKFCPLCGAKMEGGGEE